MTEFVTTVDVERPLETVWNYLTDLHRMKDWSSNVVDTVYLGPIRLGVTGIDFRRVGKNQITVNWEVIGYHPPTLLILTFGPPVNSIARFSFRSTPTGGTRLTCRTTIKTNGWMRLFTPLAVAEARRTDEKQLAKAKSNLENRQIHRSPGPRTSVIAEHSR